MVGVSDRYPPIFEKIADTLVRELPVGWTKAWAYAEMTEHDGGVVVYYLDGPRSIKWITPPLALYERFRELNNAARMPGSTPPWTTATFALEPSGKLDLDFGYDAVPPGDERARRAAWKARYLPPAM